jgi:iron-sulfur cluster assembly accessory protein
MTVIEPSAIGIGANATPVLSMSEPAASRLLQMMNEKELSGYGLRVFVAGGGCSGLQYGMTFDNEGRDGDTAFEAHGLNVMIDPISYRYLKGATIDYVDSLMGGGFKIENPNAVSGCGCGSSFRPKEDESEDYGATEAEDAYGYSDAQGGGCGSGGCGCGH